MKVLISASAPVRKTTDLNKDPISGVGAVSYLADALNKIAGSYNPVSTAHTEGFCKFRTLNADPLKVAVKGFRTLPVEVEKVTTERKSEKAKPVKVVKAILSCNGKRKTIDLSVPRAEAKKKLLAIINSWYKDEVFGPNKTKFKPIKE